LLVLFVTPHGYREQDTCFIRAVPKSGFVVGILRVEVQSQTLYFIAKHLGKWIKMINASGQNKMAIFTLDTLIMPPKVAIIRSGFTTLPGYSINSYSFRGLKLNWRDMVRN